jgi:hypothetical protein
MEAAEEVSNYTTFSLTGRYVEFRCLEFGNVCPFGNITKLDSVDL